MREFTKVSPSVWRSRKFRSLPDADARMVYLYLLTCPHGNSAGCFDIHPLYASADLGITVEAYRKAIDTLYHTQLIDFDEAENTVLIVQWEDFNEPTNPKHAIGLLSALKQASSKRLKSLCFHAFLAVFCKKGFDRDIALRKAIDIFLIAYPKAIATETETETEMESEMETRPDRDKTETRDLSRAAALPAATLTGGGRSPFNPCLQAPINGPSAKLLAIVQRDEEMSMRFPT